MIVVVRHAATISAEGTIIAGSTLKQSAQRAALKPGNRKRRQQNERVNKMDRINVETLEHMKPCPFCGSEKITLSYITPGTTIKLWSARCDGCGINTGHDPVTPDEAIKKWNRRVIEPEQFERLKRCNHECKIDCLLKEYDRVKEERDKARSEKAFLLDRIKSLIRSTMVVERDMHL